MTTRRTRSPQEYLFVPDVAALRRKIRCATGTPAYLWRAIQTLPLAAGNGRYYPAFLYLVTGREEYARQALAELKAAMEFYRAGELSIDVHFHTWCNSAPMARLAVMLDWIADSKAVSRADYAALKEAMLDYTLKHPYNIAKSRVRTFDNQISAMSFCCALVGYLFGVKRGRDLRAQRLLEAGLMRFPDIFALSPPGGYSYEGSTYFCQIVAPVVSWYCALLEQITGESVFRRPFPPSNVTPEEILRTYHKLVGPSGLMPPWDNYGWMQCASTMGLAYLARQTGDPAPLATVERLHLAAEPAFIAWGSDDKLWTLLWWPDDLEAGAARPSGSWAIPNVAGALVEPGQSWRLFQAWDRCNGSVYCGRAQVNPNMLSLDLWGSPVFTDGTPDHAACTLFDYPVEAFRDVLQPGEYDSIVSYYRTFVPNWDPKMWVKAFSYGLIGASSSIVVNDEGHYSPPESREGRLTAFAALPNLKLVAADAAVFYQPRYPIRSMVRTSVLVRDEYFLVCDAIRADADLRFDWQVFARGAVSAESDVAAISTPEGVDLDIVPLNPAAHLALTDVPGFPKGLEGRSTRIRFGVQGADVELPFLLVPHRRLAPVADLSGGWSAVRLAKDAGEAQGLPRGVGAAAKVAAGDCGLMPGDGDDGWVWAGRSFTVPAAARKERLFLHLPSSVYGLRMWVNGAAVPLEGQTEKPDAPREWYRPSSTEITAQLKPGRNTLVIAGKTCQGKLLGPRVELMRAVAKPARPEARQTGPGAFEIRGRGGVEQLVLGGAEGRVATAEVSGRAQAVLFRSGDSFAALQCTELAAGGVRFRSDRPLDVSVEAGVVTLGDLSGPEVLELDHPQFRLRVESRGVLDVDLCGRRLPRVVTHLEAAKPVFVNGCAVAAKRDAFSGRLEIAVPTTKAVPESDPAMPRYVARLESLMRAATRGESGVAKKLLAGLGDRDWKVRQVAAELLGRCGGGAAVSPLLAVLEAESADRIYADELFWWKDALAKYREDKTLWEAGPGSTPERVNRHRLKTTVIEALGRLRAKEAVPALCRILEDQREFYPVHSAACQALGRIGDPAAVPALEKASGYAEINTKLRARDAIHRIREGRPVHADYPDRAEG